MEGQGVKFCRIARRYRNFYIKALMNERRLAKKRRNITFGNEFATAGIRSIRRKQLRFCRTEKRKKMSKEIARTRRTKIKRLPKRGSFERDRIYKILDEAFVCHVGFIVDDESFVIPTGYARAGDNLIIHGSSASRMMRAMAWEKPICVTVTLVDGLVLARSAFHHSMNYRSVVIFGKANLISDEQEKIAALKALTEHIVPRRWQEVRPPSELELKATTVLSVPIEEASAKIRTGHPVDDEADYDLDVWAGVIPLKLKAEKPIADEKLKKEVATPVYVSNYKRA